jgi:hypothetical protein
LGHRVEKGGVECKVLQGLKPGICESFSARLTSRCFTRHSSRRGEVVPFTKLCSSRSILSGLCVDTIRVEERESIPPAAKAVRFLCDLSRPT